jgi:hypothetical protein
VRCHRLHHVRHRQDARLEQDFLAFEAPRITAAVHPLMVLAHDLGDRPRKIDVLEDLVALLGMGLDHLELDRREFSRL